MTVRGNMYRGFESLPLRHFSSEAYPQKNYIFLGRESDFYKNLEIALDRIDDGIFGICKICAELIPEERMLEVPNATKCVGCKEKEKLGLV